jgi:hypothetical protein
MRVPQQLQGKIEDPNKCMTGTPGQFDLDPPAVRSEIGVDQRDEAKENIYKTKRGNYWTIHAARLFKLPASACPYL